MINETDVMEQEAPKVINMDVVKLNVTDTEIARMKEEYLPLKINGLEDKEGLKKVYESRQIVKKTRTSLVRYADALKEKSLAWQRKVNGEKNRIVAELEDIEAHLQAEENKIDRAKEDLRLAEERAKQAIVQARINRLAEYDYGIDLTFLQGISDETFEKVLENARVEFEKEQARIADEKRLADEAAAKLKADQEELALLREKQAHSQRIIDQENERIAREQQAKEDEIKRQDDKVRAELAAFELAKKIDEQNRQRDIQLEAALKEATEKERLRLIEEQKQKAIAEEEKLNASSDKVKFKAVAATLTSIVIPAMKSRKAMKLHEEVRGMIDRIVEHIGKNI